RADDLREPWVCGRTTTLCLSPDASTSRTQRSEPPEARHLGARSANARAFAQSVGREVTVAIGPSGGNRRVSLSRLGWAAGVRAGHVPTVGVGAGRTEQDVGPATAALMI